MSRSCLFWLLAALLPAGAWADEKAGSGSEGPADLLNTREGRSPATAKVRPSVRPHEALREPAKERVSRVFVDRGPPPVVRERAGIAPPSPEARWLEGYWEWDENHKDYVWVTGTWHVPPRGSFWVSGYWRRGESGWFRVPGFWSGRAAERHDWHVTGPPRDRPKEAIPPAPGPDYFYVPGQYMPVESEVVWRPGYWTQAKPGWEWIPARWVRQSSGWTFRKGYWKRVGSVPASPFDRRRVPRESALTASVRAWP